MSEQNVELVRRGYEEFNRRGLEAFYAFLDPDVEFIPPGDWPDAPTSRGIDRIREVARLWTETFEDFRIDPEEFIDVDADRVLVSVRDRGRVKGSGAEIDQPFFHVWTVSEGKIVRWQSFGDRTAALEAVGIKQQSR